MFLADIWGSTNNHTALAVFRGGAPKHIWPSSPALATLAAERLDARGWDVFYSVGSFAREARDKHNAYVGAMFVDIDCGEDKPYSTKKEGLLALLTWCQKHDFPQPSHIVDSGNGIHAYWALDAFYPRSEWLPVAEKFKQALAVGGVAVDPVVTADASRVLRVPGTHNYKDPNNPKLVRLLRRADVRLPLAEFNSRLPQVGPVGAVGGATHRVFDLPMDFPPGNAEAIADKCQQMGDIRDKKGAVSEPLWRAGLSILQRCESNKHYIKEWSTGDERYDDKEALDKAAQTKGPYTCKSFSDVRPVGCEGCPHAGNITSPIQLRAASGDAAIRVGSYIKTSKGVFLDSEEEGQKLICEVPIWLTEVRIGANTDGIRGASTLEAHWVSLSGRPQKATVRQSSVQSKDEFVRWLADNNLSSAVRSVTSMRGYITEFTRKVELEKGTAIFHEVLGWSDEGFVLGDRVINKEGKKAALVHTSSPIKNITAKGGVDAWVEGANKFNSPEYHAHAFAVLAGFGSPLLYPSGKQSAVVSLVGPSGAGKTLAAHAALSIYGNYEDLSLGASSTTNMVTKHLESCRHVPFLLDEVTQYSTKRLTQFIYDAANGQPKSSLTRNRDARPTYNWKLVPFLTSNAPILDNEQSEVQEAHRRRLLEVHFSEGMDGDVGGAVDKAITENYGVAGDVYLPAVAKLLPSMSGLVAKEAEKIKKQYNLPDVNRFGTWTLAAAKIGGLIAKKLGLIDYNVDAVIAYAAASLATQAEETATVGELASEALSEWLTQHAEQISVWREGARNSLTISDPIARVMGDTVAIHRAKLNQLLRDKGLSRKGLKEWLAYMGEGVTRRCRMCSGLPPVMCYVFDREKTGLSDEE